MNVSPGKYTTHSTSASTETYILQSQPNTKEILPTKKKTLISSTFPPKQAKSQSNSRPVSKQLIPMIKQSTLVELPSSDKGKFTTKNKYILSAVQQPRNEIPAERTRRKKRQLRKFQGTQLQESVENQFELSSPSQRTKGQEINIFYGNFLHLLPFLQQKLFITFSSIGFQTMSLKRTIRYSIFLISFITSVSFLNLNLAFNSIDRNPVDAGLRLGLHETFRRRYGRPVSASCALNLCPVTTGNCPQFYSKTSSTNLSLYGKMAAITNMKIEQNYSKDIFNESISQNLQPIRNNERNIKYHWIIFTMSLLFLYRQLYNRRSKVLFVIISLIQFTIAFHSLKFVCHSKPSLNTILRNSPTKEFFTIEVLRITYKINEFSADMHFKLFTISKMKNKYNRLYLKMTLILSGDIELNPGQ